MMRLLRPIALLAVGAALLPSCSSPTDSSQDDNRVRPPVFLPPAGNYGRAQDVSVSCATAGAVIYYTTDGKVPDTLSTVYSAPVQVPESMDIKAFASLEGLDPSPVVTASYTIDSPMVALPVITPSGGSHTGRTTVSITCATPGAVIYYAFGTGTPETDDLLYTDSITISASTTISAVAMKDGYLSSDVVRADFTLDARAVGEVMVYWRQGLGASSSYLPTYGIGYEEDYYAVYSLNPEAGILMEVASYYSPSWSTNNSWPLTVNDRLLIYRVTADNSSRSMHERDPLTHDITDISLDMDHIYAGWAFIGNRFYFKESRYTETIFYPPSIATRGGHLAYEDLTTGDRTRLISYGDTDNEDMFSLHTDGTNLYSYVVDSDSVIVQRRDLNTGLVVEEALHYGFPIAPYDDLYTFDGASFYYPALNGTVVEVNRVAFGQATASLVYSYDAGTDYVREFDVSQGVVAMKLNDGPLLVYDSAAAQETIVISDIEFAYMAVLKIQ